jgi:hypothetical protein
MGDYELHIMMWQSVNAVGMRTFCQVTAVVICLNETLGVIGIDVEGVQVRADALDWSEVLFGTVNIHIHVTMHCVQAGCMKGRRPHLSHACTRF